MGQGTESALALSAFPQATPTASTASAAPTARLAPVASLASPASPAPVAREGRGSYDASPGEATIGALVEADRDDVLRNLQDAEAALREVFPELVLALVGAAGEEFLIRQTAQALGRLSIATRTIEDRVAAGPPSSDE